MPTNIEMQTMNAVCAIPRALREISEKLDRLAEAVASRGKKDTDEKKKKDLAAQ